MSKIKIFLAALVVGLTFLSMTPRLYAFNAFQDACDGSTASNNSSVCQDKTANNSTNPADPNGGFLPKIANIIAAVGGLIAVIFIMVNGFNIMTSTGDSAKLSKAREGIIYAAIGIVVIVLARTIIAVILRYV